MATVRKTITLTGQQDDWIKAQVEGGQYTNDSESIRDLHSARSFPGKSAEAEIEAILAALDRG